MKLFWMRVVNVALIVLVLVVYQSQAHARTQIAAAQQEQQKALQMQEQLQQAIDQQEFSDGPTERTGAEDATAQTGTYADGTYSGTAAGFSGDLTVSVTVQQGKITDVAVTQSQDDAEYLDKASALLDEIVAAQGTQGVDVVSGATFSSNGILGAVDNALGGQS